MLILHTEILVGAIVMPALAISGRAANGTEA